MALGIRTYKIRRSAPGEVTTIDGLPVSFSPGLPSYVDGAASVNGNGTSYADAFSTIQAAVTAAAANGTIFIKPLALGAYYTESVIVPAATIGLNLVGTTYAAKGGSVYQAVTWRNSSNSVDDSALDLRSAHSIVENIHFFSRAAQSSGFGIRSYWNTGSGTAIGNAILNCGFSADLADHPAAAGVVQSAIRFDSNEGMRIEGNVFVDCRVGIASGSTMNAWKELWIVDNHFNGLAANVAADLFLADGTNLAIIGNHFGHTVPSHAAGTMAKYVFCIGGTTITGSASGNYFGSANAGYGTDNTNNAGIIRSGNFYSAGIMTS